RNGSISATGQNMCATSVSRSKLRLPALGNCASRRAAFVLSIVVISFHSPVIYTRASTFVFDAPTTPPASVETRTNYVNGSISAEAAGPFAGTNINSLLGASAFYDRGLNGANSVIANIEEGHIWNGHETLTHVLQIPNHPAALNEFDRHATWVGM